MKKTMQKRILSLLVGRDDGVVMSYFGIVHENKLWLVTSWLINQATGFATPERMIRVDSLDPHPTKVDASENSKFDYVNILLPKAVIEGVSQDTPRFEVRSLSDEPIVHRDELYVLPRIFE
jgi:hypothetical protein